MTDDETQMTLDGPVWDELRASMSLGETVVSGWGAATSQGTKRERNEDSWGHADDRVFIVADGMGGYEGGDIAADVAVRSLVAASEIGLEPDWLRWIMSANMAIRVSAAQRGYRRSGAAIVGCSVHENVATVAHVGDARAYRVRSGRLEQLTADHSVRQGLINDGLGELATGRGDRELGALTRHLGGVDDLAIPTMCTVVPQPGDRLILCSDGVSRQLSHAELEAAGATADPQGAARLLVATADLNGGRDNATAMCIDFESALPEEVRN